MSPVADSATAFSNGKITTRNLRGDAGADLEAAGRRRSGGRDRHGRRRRPSPPRAARVRPGRAAREAARPARRGPAAGGGGAPRPVSALLAPHAVTWRLAAVAELVAETEQAVTIAFD